MILTKQYFFSYPFSYLELIHVSFTYKMARWGEMFQTKSLEMK